MPNSPPDGRPLTGVLTIVSADGSSVPETIKVERVWIVHDGEVWSTRLIDETALEQDLSHRIVIRGGPTWKPDTVADVIVLLSDETGESALLGAVDQRITATF